MHPHTPGATFQWEARSQKENYSNTVQDKHRSFIPVEQKEL